MDRCASSCAPVICALCALTWSTSHDSLVWARLMDTHTHATEPAARTGAWRTLRRLERHRLIRCERAYGSTRISVTLLREDGTGAAYDRPQGETEAERYLQVPRAFWTKGHDERIDIPGLALLLTVAREKPWSAFPAEKAPEWYGWSADTHMRGLHKLLALGLVERREKYTKAPLSPTGYTMTHQYQLVSWMRPRKDAREAAPSVATGTTNHHATAAVRAEQANGAQTRHGRG
jgi:hypothetical protein